MRLLTKSCAGFRESWNCDYQKTDARLMLTCFGEISRIIFSDQGKAIKIEFLNKYLTKNNLETI
jgi:hypothetical protein